VGERPGQRRNAAPSSGEQSAQVLRRAIAHVESLLQRVDPAAVPGAGGEPTVVSFEKLGSLSTGPLVRQEPRRDASRLIDQAVGERERVLADAQLQAAAIVAAARQAAADAQEQVAVLLAALRSATRTLEQALDIAGIVTASSAAPAVAGAPSDRPAS
jgi:hypothetical protein